MLLGNRKTHWKWEQNLSHSTLSLDKPTMLVVHIQPCHTSTTALGYTVSYYQRLGLYSYLFLQLQRWCGIRERLLLLRLGVKSSFRFEETLNQMPWWVPEKNHTTSDMPQEQQQWPFWWTQLSQESPVMEEKTSFHPPHPKWKLSSRSARVSGKMPPFEDLQGKRV